MNETQLSSIIERASMLINNDEFNRIVEQKSGNLKFSPNGDVTYNKTNNNYQTVLEDFSSKNNSNKGLPKEILESFQKVPPNNGSVLENITKNIKTPQNSINEKITNTFNAPIDYSLIKMIVNECISSYFNNFKENVLNENIVKGFTIKNGNKIQFLTRNGDLYEGELKLKKRKNE